MTICLQAQEAKVTIHLLDHTGKPTPAASNRFSTQWQNDWRIIEDTKDLTGEDAEMLIKQLRGSLKTVRSGNGCGHDPIYAIIAKTKDGESITTSLCFTCLTWMNGDSRMSLDGEPNIENTLCKLLRSHIELPESILNKKQ